VRRFADGRQGQPRAWRRACPKAEEETHVLLSEPSGTVNTGDAGGELTAPERTI
jgi:hypothetical protein